MQEHLSGEAWKGVSDAAKHLVSKLLVVSPKHRITVDKALSHNWMKGIDEADSPTLFRHSSSETSSGGPTDEIDDFSDEEEWRHKDESKRHATAVPAAPAKRVKATLDLGPDSAQALRPTPLQGARQHPEPPAASPSTHLQAAAHLQAARLQQQQQQADPLQTPAPASEAASPVGETSCQLEQPSEPARVYCPTCTKTEQVIKSVLSG